MYDKISGIYCIKNIVDGKKYIGYSKDIFSRWKDHKYDLRKNSHKNKYLQNAWNKYGENNFEFYIIQKLKYNNEILGNLEIYWIAYYNSYLEDGCGYNLTRGGEIVNNLPEVIRKEMGNNQLGEKNHNYNKPITEDHKLAISIANSGENNYWFGRHQTEENKKKLSLSMSGENNPFYGKKHSGEEKERMINNRCEYAKGMDAYWFKSKEDVMKIKALLDAKISLREISRTTGISLPTIRKVRDGGYMEAYGI